MAFLRSLSARTSYFLVCLVVAAVLAVEAQAAGFQYDLYGDSFFSDSSSSSSSKQPTDKPSLKVVLIIIACCLVVPGLLLTICVMCVCTKPQRVSAPFVTDPVCVSIAVSRASLFFPLHFVCFCFMIVTTFSTADKEPGEVRR